MITQLYNISLIYKGLNEYDKVLEHENRSMLSFLHTITRQVQRHSRLPFSVVHTMLGNHEKANNSLRLHLAIKDSLINDNNALETGRLESMEIEEEKARYFDFNWKYGNSLLTLINDIQNLFSQKSNEKGLEFILEVDKNVSQILVIPKIIIKQDLDKLI